MLFDVGNYVYLMRCFRTKTRRGQAGAGAGGETELPARALPQLQLLLLLPAHSTNKTNNSHRYTRVKFKLNISWETKQNLTMKSYLQ